MFTYCITFTFHASCFPLQIYTSISNKVVGVLLRARKHKFLDFEGETLFQASSVEL
jgi:hypothetical protein